MTDYSKVAILTTVINFKLYHKTAKLFPCGVQKYVIDGRNGMHGIYSIIYMMQVLKNKDIEWLIMVDEDIIFTHPERVFSIIDEMKKNNYTACGVRDGGIIEHRIYNPFAMNTFFSILNFKEIKNNWNKKEIKRNQFILKNEFQDDLSKLKGKYDTLSIYEPYYCFYFWLRRKMKKILFLDATNHNDTITNSVLFNNKTFLYHTWYARSYGNNEKHTIRINSILNESLTGSTDNTVDYILYKDKLFYTKSMFKKILKKVKLKFNMLIITIIFA